MKKLMLVSLCAVTFLAGCGKNTPAITVGPQQANPQGSASAQPVTSVSKSVDQSQQIIDVHGAPTGLTPAAG